MGHGADDKNLAIPRERLDAAGATDVASILQALATPSRLYILARLQKGPCAVGERQGRSIVYALYGHHVAELLEQALFHVEHLRLGLRDTPAERIETLVRWAGRPSHCCAVIPSASCTQPHGGRSARHPRRPWTVRWIP